MRKKIYSTVHFCIILPQDCFDGIAAADRDFAKRSFCSLNWDAHDLMEMLVKRLEYHYGCKNCVKGNLEERFNNILQQYMPKIPRSIGIDIDGYEYGMSLFNYLLRNTFWRPRDIIKNFAIVMKLSKDEHTITDVVQIVIKKFLVTGAKNIIHEEFFFEYKNVYTNLEEVLYKFKGTDILQSYETFVERLAKINIRTTTEEDFSTVFSKLTFLYKLGVVGLYSKKEYAEKKGYGYHTCFVFNEGLDPIEEFAYDERVDIAPKIIFNPIFAKKLDLNYNTKELICNYPWQYIQANHALKDNIRRI